MLPNPPRSGKFPKLLIIIALIAAATGLWYAFGRGDKDKAKGPQAVPVSVSAVERRDVPLELREVGTAVAYEAVAVRSRLDSQVTEVKFKDGDAVKKGDLLFVLDDRTLKAEALQLEANLRRDKAQMENFRQQYERSQNLTAKGFEAKANLDNAKAAYEAQKASVGASAAALESLNVQLGYTRITAPIDGRTGTINVTVGNNARAGDAQALVTINQVQPIRVQTSISQTYLDAVRSAMAQGPVSVMAMREEGGEIAEGTLEYIDNAVDLATGAFAARAVFANAEEKLWPGVFVTLVLKLGEEKQALTIPEVAVQRGQQGDYVFTIAENKAAKRMVKVARMQDSLAVIADGLKEGEQVVTDGTLSLKEGSDVKVQDAKTQEKNDAH